MNSNDSVDQVEHLILNLDVLINRVESKQTSTFGEYIYYLDQEIETMFKDIVLGIKFLKIKGILTEDLLRKFNEEFMDTIIGNPETFNQPVNGNKFNVSYLPYSSYIFIKNLVEIKENLKNQMEYLKRTLNKKYLELKDDGFYYAGKKLRLEPNTNPYNLLRSLYMITDGNSGKVTYTDLQKELSRYSNRYRSKSLKDIKILIRKNLTSKKSIIQKQLVPVEENGKPLIKTIKKFGLSFNNEISVKPVDN